MRWLKYITGFLLFLLSLAADYTILWSDFDINDQVKDVLYGSSVEFRCHNKTVNNLYEVSKEEFNSCELQHYHRSLLNCTRDTERGKDIYTALFVQHPVYNPSYKDYLTGQSYYFISTASDRGTDRERISNMAGGNCKKKGMKVTIRVVSTITTKDVTEPSQNDKSNIPDPGGQAIPDITNSTNNSQYNTSSDEVADDQATSSGSSSTADSLTAPKHHNSRVLALLLLTLMYMLYS